MKNTFLDWGLVCSLLVISDQVCATAVNIYSFRVNHHFPLIHFTDGEPKALVFCAVEVCVDTKNICVRVSLLFKSHAMNQVDVQP